jgi:hypothetical protein
MKVADIIRSFLDALDQIDPDQCVPDDTPMGYTDADIPRLRQIAGLLPQDNPMSVLANEPNPQYADVDAVLASGDDVHKSKHPADIRTDAPSMYPAAQWRP